MTELLLPGEFHYTGQFKRKAEVPLHYRHGDEVRVDR